MVRVVTRHIKRVCVLAGVAGCVVTSANEPEPATLTIRSVAGLDSGGLASITAEWRVNDAFQESELLENVQQFVLVWEVLGSDDSSFSETKESRGEVHDLQPDTSYSFQVLAEDHDEMQAAWTPKIEFHTYAAQLEKYRGLRIEEERTNCTDPYDRDDYSFRSSPELRSLIATNQRGEYSPFHRDAELEENLETVEHIVALAEADGSGLCRRPRDDKRAFADDIQNLTFASRSANSSKSSTDAAEYCKADGEPRKFWQEMSSISRCWLVERTLAVKRHWDLSVDRNEAIAIERILQHCDSGRIIRLCE